MIASIERRGEAPGPQTQERAGECRLLGRLLAAPPDATLLRDCQAVGLIEPGWGAKLESFAVEFSRLFSVPGPEAIAAHQSIYTDTLRLEASDPDKLGCGLAFAGGEFTGYLGGESCSEARRWYAAAGFEPRDPSPAMADHISTQLDFLAHLRLGEAQAVELGQPEEARAFEELRGQFVARFLGRWGEGFAERLAANDASAFYRRVGSRLLDVLRRAPPGKELP